ncbi:MAG: hypothetical protein NVSMB32_06170 [Actinomycetota bacterium]
MTDADTMAIQEQILGAIRTSQEATVNVAKTWVQTFTTVAPKMVDGFQAPKFESYYGFVEKMWGTQRDFFGKMLDVASEMSQKLPETYKKAAASAEHATRAATKS